MIEHSSAGNAENLHYLQTIRVRMETLYVASANNSVTNETIVARLRTQLSDEIDWIDAQIEQANRPAQLQSDPECPDCFTDRECELYFALMLLASHALAWHRDYEQWMQGGLKVEPVVSKALRLNTPALASPDGAKP